MNNNLSSDSDSCQQPTLLLPVFRRQKSAAANVTSSTPVHRAASSEVHIGPVFARWKDPGHLRTYRRNKSKSTDMPSANGVGMVFKQEQIIARDVQHPPHHRLHLPVAGQAPEKSRRLGNRGQPVFQWLPAPDRGASSSLANHLGRRSSVRLTDKPNALGFSSEVVNVLHDQVMQQETQRVSTTSAFEWDGARKEENEGKAKGKAAPKAKDRTWVAYIMAGFKLDKRPWK